MDRTEEPWFIRLPDGRVRRASSTASVRRHLTAGHIPLASLVRRSAEDEWTSLEWTTEFADLVEQLHAAPVPPDNHAKPHEKSSARAQEPPGAAVSVASRLDPDALQTVGVQGWLQELLAAVDSLLVARKLLVASLAGLVLGVVVALFRGGFINLETLGFGLTATVTAGAVALVLAVSSGMLTRMTYVEVAQLRPARWRDGIRELPTLATRLILFYLLVLGGTLLVLSGLLALTFWLLLPNGGLTPAEAAAAVALTVAAMLIAVLLTPLCCLCLLFGPILVAERVTVWRGIGEWKRFLLRHFWRVLAYEILAVAIGMLITLPFVLSLFPLPYLPLDVQLGRTWAFTRDVLAALAVAPLLAYLTVANLFIYLNLRYGNAQKDMK